jgi:UDP-glucose 4-epimerase
MARTLVTGGSGFLGSLLVNRLLDDGHHVTNIDLVPSENRAERLHTVVGDLRNRAMLDEVLQRSKHDVVFHCAALLAHGVKDLNEVWSSNVVGTRVLAEAVAAAQVPVLVYTSSNCLWAAEFSRPVHEDDAPAPVEIYGKSKWEGERILRRFDRQFASIVIRCPTIIDEGRLGLLTLLFEFIADGRKVWVVGDGSNRYQFIYARDLIEAMLLSWRFGRSSVYGIGADEVLPMRATYEYVIAKAGSNSKVVSLPKRPTILGMKTAHALGISPLGPYHFRMIASNFTFDTSKIKSELGWRPTLSNQEMLWRAYRYYGDHRMEIHSRTSVSAHRKPASMGVIRILKWLS